MTSRIGLVTPVKAAVGQWLSRFYAQFQPDTDANAEWATRGTSTAIFWAPARMVDSVDAMLSSWRNNNNSGVAGTSAFMPVMFMAVASDYTETPGEAGRPLTDYMPINLPGDTLKRSFRVRMISADLRAQVVVVASEPLSAMSMIGQLSAWASEVPRFKSVYPFAGLTSEWPVSVVGADRMAIPTPIGEQMSILTLDLTLRASMPMFYGPQGDEANDGSGADPGYPLVSVVTNQHNQSLGPPTGVTAEEWAAYTLRTAAYSASMAKVVLLPLSDQVKAHV